MSNIAKFAAASIWFCQLDDIYQDLAREMMKYAQEAYGFAFDKALIMVHESYLLSRQATAKGDNKPAAEYTDAEVKALRAELNGPKKSE
jgi:hypothetical protein